MLKGIRSFLRRSSAEVPPPAAAPPPPPPATFPAAAAGSPPAAAKPSSSSTSITARPKNNFFKDVFGNAVPIHDGGLVNRALTKKAFNEAFKSAFTEGGEHHPARLNINNRNYFVGQFSTPTLKECRDALIGITSSDDFKKIPADKIKLNEKEKVADGKDLIPSGSAKNDAYLMHVTETEAGLFQAASQFNALEFISQHQKPENGISCYIDDETQGPACAVACGAGLAYKNDIVDVVEGVVCESSEWKGQTEDNQINFLVTAQKLLNDKAKEKNIAIPDKETAEGKDMRGVTIDKIPIGDGDFFVVKNGYVESTDNNLRALNQLLTSEVGDFRNELKNAIRAGIHRNVEVTADPNSSDANPRLVNQIYVSALSIGYSTVKDKPLWELMAKICLESAYEHTLIEGLRNNAERILAGKPPRKIMLTKVGGGVFENQPQWIEEAMTKAIKEAGSYGIPFEVELVHYNKDDANRYYGDDKATQGSLEKAIEEANKIALQVIKNRREAEAAGAAAPAVAALPPVAAAAADLVAADSLAAAPAALAGAGADPAAPPTAAPAADSLAAAVGVGAGAASLAAAPAPAASLVFVSPPAADSLVAAGSLPAAAAGSPPPPPSPPAPPLPPAAVAPAAAPAPAPVAAPPPAGAAAPAAAAPAAATAAADPAGGVWGPAAAAPPPAAPPPAGAAAPPPAAKEVFHYVVHVDPNIEKASLIGPGAEAKTPAGGAGVGGDPAGGAGEPPAVAPPAIAPAPFIFPDVLKAHSPIHQFFQSAIKADGEKKPIVLVASKAKNENDPRKNPEYFFNLIKKHYDPSDPQKIILSHNPTGHWSVYEGSSAENSFDEKHLIRGNGYCGLISAITTSKLITASNLPKNEGEKIDLLQRVKLQDDQLYLDILTERDSSLTDENKRVLLDSCFGQVGSEAGVIDDETKNNLETQTELIDDERVKLSKRQAYDVVVKLIDNKGKESIKSTDANGKEITEKLWLTDDQIIEIVKHRNGQEFVTIEESSWEKLTRTPHFERKVAFLKYLKDDQVKISANFGDEMGGVTLEDLLLSDKSKYSGEPTQLCLNVLDKFIKEDDSQDKKGKFLVFYKLMLDCAQHQDVWGASTDNRFAKLKESFDVYAGGNDIKDNPDYKKVKQDLEKAEEELVKKYLLKPVRESFFNQLENNSKDSEETSDNKKRNLESLKGLLEDISKKENGTFKDRIEDLSKQVNAKPLQFTEVFIDYFNCLNRRDPDFIPAIIPEILQLKPKIPFKGWGKKIEFKDGKILIDDQEVKEIKNQRGEDIIKELRKDFPQESAQKDHPLFKHAVIDFLRNTDEVTLVYSDQTESKLEQGQKETLICNNPSKLFEKVAGNPEVDKIDTKELMLSRVKAHSEKTVGRGDEARAGVKAGGKAGGKAGAKVPLGKEPQTIEEKRQALEEIKKHLDERFKLLGEMLKGDPNAIVVIPGFIKTKDGTQEEAYSLGTGLAVGQWGKDDESKKLSKECRDHIKAKIDALKTNYSDRILLGNVGNQISEKTDSNGVLEKYYLPQFPIGDGNINYARDTTKDQTKLQEAEDRLIENYKSMCTNLKINVSTVPKKVNNNQDDIIREYQKLLFGDPADSSYKDYYFNDKKFIHVWGANCRNFNNDKGSPIEGGGQANAFKKKDENDNALGQQFGIFGIVTTIHNYDASQFGNADKTYGSPSSSPILAPSRTSSSASAASAHST